VTSSERHAEDEHSVTFIEELQRRLAQQAAPDAKGGGRMTSSQSSPNLTTQVGPSSVRWAYLQSSGPAWQHQACIRVLLYHALCVGYNGAAVPALDGYLAAETRRLSSASSAVTQSIGCRPAGGCGGRQRRGVRQRRHDAHREH